MADGLPWILISVLALLVLGVAAVALLYKKRGQKQKTDYYAFFWMGLVWTVFGAAMTVFDFFMGYDYTTTFFLPMGVVFLALGLANRDKWKDRPEYTKNKRLMIIFTLIAGIIALAGVFAFMMFL